MSVNPDQVGYWRAAGLRYGFEVMAPCRVVLSNGATVEATALVMVGPERGMVVDPKWSVIEPHAEQLRVEGFGYSAVTIDGAEDLEDILQDWAGP